MKFLGCKKYLENDQIQSTFIFIDRYSLVIQSTWIIMESSCICHTLLIVPMSLLLQLYVSHMLGTCVLQILPNKAVLVHLIVSRDNFTQAHYGVNKIYCTLRNMYGGKIQACTSWWLKLTTCLYWSVHPDSRQQGHRQMEAANAPTLVPTEVA